MKGFVLLLCFWAPIFLFALPYNTHFNNVTGVKPYPISRGITSFNCEAFYDLKVGYYLNLMNDKCILIFWVFLFVTCIISVDVKEGCTLSYEVLSSSLIISDFKTRPVIVFFFHSWVFNWGKTWKPNVSFLGIGWINTVNIFSLGQIHYNKKFYWAIAA